LKLLALNCNNCGAGIEVPRNAKFATCGFCDARLSVQQTETSAFTEVLGEVAEDIKEIKRNTEVTRLDQEWMLRRERHQVCGQNGTVSKPSAVAGVAMIAVGVLGGLTVMQEFAGFGLLFMAIGGIGGMVHLNKAQAYDKEHASYRRRRRELMRG